MITAIRDKCVFSSIEYDESSKSILLCEVDGVVRYSLDGVQWPQIDLSNDDWDTEKLISNIRTSIQFRTVGNAKGYVHA